MSPPDPTVAIRRTVVGAPLLWAGWAVALPRWAAAATSAGLVVVMVVLLRRGGRGSGR